MMIHYRNFSMQLNRQTTLMHQVCQSSLLRSQLLTVLPGPGPSSSSSAPHTGDASGGVHVLPQSQEFNNFYPLPFPQSLAGPSHPERFQRGRPSSSAPYFIPEPRLIMHYQPPPPAANSFNTLQPMMMTTAAVALQPADDSVVPAVVTPHPAIISITPTVQQPSPPIIINVSHEVKKQIVDRTKRKVTRFLLTPSTMATTDYEKTQLVSQAISESTPAIPGMNGKSSPMLSNWFLT